MLEIRIIDSHEHLESIRSDWELLFDEMANNVSAFASHAWYETWWQHFSAGADLYLVTAWEADRLVGIAPLMRRRMNLHGLPVKVIDFIENRNSLHNDFIVVPAAREWFLREVLRVLFELTAQWDLIVFNNLPLTSANNGALVNILDETGRKWQQGTTFNSPYLLLFGSWADYLASRTTRTRKSLRNIQNSIAKAGEVSVRNIRTWEEFQQVRGDLNYVAKQSWTEQIGDSLATSVNEAFFDALARSAAAKGWLSVWTLHLNGKMIAFEFHLKGCGKDHAMRGSYLPEFAHLSPGTYLEMQILKNAFEETDKVQKYDFGGSFDSYKRKWTDDAVPHCAISIFNDRWYSRFVSFYEGSTVTLARKIRDRIRKAKTD